MQLRLDAADRLVELVEEQRGPVARGGRGAAAVRPPPGARRPRALAARGRRRDRCAARVERRRRRRSREPPGAALLLEEATYVVVDLETTGLRPGQSGICEIGAVRLRGFEVEAEFETLVDPGLPIDAGASAVTGLRNEQLRGAPRPAEAVRSFLDFAGDAVLVAHNARFDLAFLDRETELLTGSRIGSRRSSTPCASRGRCSPAAWRASASVSSRGSSTPRSGRATGRCRTPARPPSCCWR